MRKISRIFITICLLFALVIGTIPITGFAAESEGYSTYGDFKYFYNRTWNTAKIYGYTGPGGMVSIPETIDGFTVNEIYGDGFKNNENITSVIFPSGLTNIASYTFQNCKKLTSVVFHAPREGKLDIEELSFMGCTALTSITIPNGDYFIHIIGNPFWGCTGLTSVNLGNSVVLEDISSCFYGCNNLESIAVDLENESYSSYGGVLFDKAGTELLICPAGIEGDYSIPDGVKFIGEDSFVCSKLRSIHIPSSIEEIKDYSFSNCNNLSDIYYEGTQDEWEKIIIGENNFSLNNVNIHFGSEEETGSITTVSDVKISSFTVDETKTGVEGTTIALSGKITLDETETSEEMLTKVIDCLSFDTSDAAVAKVLSCNEVQSSDHCSAELTIWTTLYQPGNVTITANMMDNKKAECQVTIKVADSQGNIDYDGDYSSDLSEIFTKSGTFNVIKYLRNEANYTASSFVYEKDSIFGSKLAMSLTDLCYRGWDGWYDLMDGSTSIEQAEKTLTSLLTVYQSDCEALSKAKTAQKYAKMIHDAFSNYSRANNMFDALSSEQMKMVTDYFDENNIAQLLYDGKYEDLMVAPNVAQICFGNDTPKEWNALMEGFSQSAEMASALKKGVNKLGGNLKNLGKCLKYLSLAQDTVNYIYQMEALLQADEMYCEMLLYVTENCKYSVVQDAASNLYIVIRDKESAIIDDLVDRAQNLAKDKVLDSLIQAACSESLVNAMCVSAFEWGVTISNTVYKTGSTQELKDMLRTEVFLGECLSRWMMEKEREYYPVVGTDEEQENAKGLYYSMYMLWQTRMCAEETLQSLLKTTSAKWSENYVVSVQILNALQSYKDNIFSKDNLSSLLGISVACPVDIEVYNSFGTKLLTVKDGDESSGFENGIYYDCSYNPLDDDYAKYIYFDKGAGYSLKIQGNDLGLVDCNIFGISEEGDTCATYFKNVQIQKNTLICLDSINTESMVYTVTAPDSSTSQSYTMEIGKAVKVESTSLALSKLSLEMKKGTKQILTFSIMPANATNQKVLWVTNNESVANVNSDGVVTATGVGTATITATLDEWTQQCTITVTDDTASATESSGEQSSGSSIKENRGIAKTENKSGTKNKTCATVTKPGQTIIRSAASKKEKSVTLSWKKVSCAKGYQIQYAINKKFKKKKSKMTSKTSTTIRKLKKKKTYYFRIRAYKLDDNKKVYGKWSKVKKVKIKK